jgi:hypothetical protein
VTHTEFFKTSATAFLGELRNKDRRSAKEWEYTNAFSVWLELKQAALALAKDNETDMTVVQMERMLAFADQALGTSRGC